MVFKLPELPYALDALEPYIDALTMEIHHGRHHAGYVASLNRAIEGLELGDVTIEDLVSSIHSLPDTVRNAVCSYGGGHVNHSLFWSVMSPRGGGKPQGDLATAINVQLGGFDSFRELFTSEATTCFGSGWAWLTIDPDKRLVVEHTHNQDSPLVHGHTPILGLDVWEHAYYLKYQNRRADYVQAFFELIDWCAVKERYLNTLKRMHLVHT